MCLDKIFPYRFLRHILQSFKFSFALVVRRQCRYHLMKLSKSLLCTQLILEIFEETWQENVIKQETSSIDTLLGINRGSYGVNDNNYNESITLQTSAKISSSTP